MNKLIHRLKYLLSDFLSASFSWFLFYVYRKIYIEAHDYSIFFQWVNDKRFLTGLAAIPFFWLSIYYFTGYYRNIYRKSRLQELGQTLFTTIVGVVILFFVLLLDDSIVTYRDYYSSLSTLFLTHFAFTYLPRLIITSITIRNIRKRKIGFSTIIVGSYTKAVELYNQFENQPLGLGYKFVGFVNINGDGNYPIAKYLTHLGNIDNIQQIVKENKIDEAIIAIESSEYEDISRIINLLDQTNVIIKVIPGMYDILRGMANMSTFYGVPLIEIKHDLMPAWQENTKRILDVVLSIIAMLILLPLYIFLIIGVLLSSKGSIMYSHERIGRYGKPFTIYKFRSMYVGAEKNGPSLSSKNDSRITPFGLFMRKLRFDELPQFYNVLIGDMSLVGPRPERQYFIDKIVEKAPYYHQLQKVRPGITSWGQVKFGYAENVDEMIERLKYDIIYLENMSLYVDFKIMIYTIMIVIKGKGQ